MMNRLENAARQALEALISAQADEHRDWAFEYLGTVIAALREALAEQQAAEPVTRRNKAYVDDLIDRLLAPPAAVTEQMLRGLHNEAAEMIHLMRRTPTPAQQQEPVEPNAVLVEGFSQVALGKLNALQSKGYAINGVSIATISEAGETNRGAVTTGGMVLWWPQQPAQQAAEPATSPTTGMNMAQRILHVGGRNNAAGYVEFGSIQAVEALVRQVLRDLPTQQPLTEEQKAVLRECRNQAMKWTGQAGIPECGAFGGIAQDLDWLCVQLGIAGSKEVATP